MELFARKRENLFGNNLLVQQAKDVITAVKERAEGLNFGAFKPEVGEFKSARELGIGVRKIVAPVVEKITGKPVTKEEVETVLNLEKYNKPYIPPDEIYGPGDAFKDALNLGLNFILPMETKIPPPIE